VPLAVATDLQRHGVRIDTLPITPEDPAPLKAQGARPRPAR
jgi:hypothetical protein